MSQGYPTLPEVEDADARQLVWWVRYLPSPTDENRPTLIRIIERRNALPEAERVAASKAVGW